MFQTFESTTTPDQGPPRIALLREAMAREGWDAVLVPRADAHQGEYVAPRDARLEWLTGFTGSAGSAVVTKDEAALFVDGRYTVQGRAQVAEEISVVLSPKIKPKEWLADRLSGGVVAFDPWLHTVKEVQDLRKALKGKGIEVRPVANPVDAIWPDQPPAPDAKAVSYPAEFAGKTSIEKRQEVAGVLREAGHRAAVLTRPESIAWLLNIRGSDIPRVPVMQAFALVHDDARVDLFCDPAKVAELGPDPSISIHGKDALASALTLLGGPVRIDFATCPWRIRDLLAEGDVEAVDGMDPCALPKARKTAAELEGARAAHRRDAVAMCRFLAWLDRQEPGTFTEIDVVTALEGFRRETNQLRDISFDTIAGAGPNGAIVHYRVTRDTDRTVAPGLLLVDSGGQYDDGTTDVTRTMLIGDPALADERNLFTAVLRGMIAISRVRFPQGVTGRDLDALARQFLWSEGRDYDHGTGHGVGHYLSVHEGPQGISRRSEVPLEPGMILSNEPGYYREGAFGIRIENLVAVQAAEAEDGRDFLGFETLTLVPIDRRLIDPTALSPEERDWIDAYHARIAKEIAPILPEPERDWLMDATRPL